jgi:hypothetical protein
MYIGVYIHAHEEICGCLVDKQASLERHRDTIEMEHPTPDAA